MSTKRHHHPRGANRLFQQTRRIARRESRRGLRIERLEDRRLMAGLVSHWTADNTAADSLGTNDGTLVSGATYAAGKVGQAFSFDGVDDRVVIADSPSLKLTGSLTIEAWVKADSLPSQHGMVLFRGDDRSGLDPYQLYLQSSGKMDFSVLGETQGQSLQAPLPLGQFVHVVGTLDDATGEMRLYMNGSVVSQVVTAARPFAELDPASNPGVGIGNHGGYPGTPHNFPFDGLIDEVRLYDVALSQQEVQDHFHMEKGPIEISVSDAGAVEGGEDCNYAGPFVAADMHGLAASRDLRVGPDGNVYVASHDSDSIKVFHPATAQYLGELTTPGGELDGPWAMAFGGDGHLYVSGRYSHNVVRFDITTGASNVFVSAGSGGLEIPWGIAFGTNGDLFASSRNDTGNYTITEPIKRYSGTTGAYLGDFVVESGEAFAGITFGPDGNLYAAARTSDSVMRYDGQTGASLGVFVPDGSGGDTNPSRLEFHAGKLYVSDHSSSSLYRYDATTGAFADMLAAPVGNSVSGFAFGSDDVIYTALGTAVLKPGSQVVQFAPSRFAAFAVSLNYASSATITVDYSTVSDTAVAGSDFAGVSGTLTFAPGEPSRTILVQTLDDGVYESSEAFRVMLSNAVGATIADDTGIGTISDNDPAPTKFYVVNDASTDRTYEYDAAGSPIQNYTLSSGNTNPRGAASNVAGDKVWVADKNRKVYVYDNAGNQQGSWSAGTLSSRAKVEGVATDGTDVWIVDDYANRVYRYANAAGRLSGSQNAASSFALNSGNRNPKGIVTDGTHIWVVNDTSTDKVFKYTTSGTLVGSWTVDSANKSPTGLTIDPSGASQNIWIVDSGSDAVYQYAGARSRTSGSQAADAVFALAAGNTNPQGIADPPAPALNAGPHSFPADPRGDATRLIDIVLGQPFAPLTKRSPGLELPDDSAAKTRVLPAWEPALPESLLHGIAAHSASTQAVQRRTPRSFNSAQLNDDYFTAWEDDDMEWIDGGGPTRPDNSQNATEPVRV